MKGEKQNSKEVPHPAPPPIVTSPPPPYDSVHSPARPTAPLPHNVHLCCNIYLL